MKILQNDAEQVFGTSNYEVNKPLFTGKSKKVIGLIKDGLAGKVMTKFTALRPKTYSYLMDDVDGVKKHRKTTKD